MTREPSAALQLDPGDVFSIDPQVVSATFGDTVVLYHLGEEQTLTLNQTAGIILELIDSRCPVAEICELLQAAFPESANVVRDVDRTLRYLLRHGVAVAACHRSW